MYYLYKIFYFEKHNLEINIKKDKTLLTFSCFYLKESPSKKKKKDGSFTKKITKKVNCLGSGVDRSSCPYGNIPDMNEVTLEHLHRIANKANFKSTFEDVNEASDSDAECGSLLDKNYNEP